MRAGVRHFVLTSLLLALAPPALGCSAIVDPDPARLGPRDDGGTCARTDAGARNDAGDPGCPGSSDHGS